MVQKTSDVYSKSNAIKSAKILVIFKSIAQLFGMLATIFLVRILSQENYGIYSAILSLFTLIGSVASFGIANTLQRFLPEYISKKQFLDAIKLIFISCHLRMWTVCLCFLIAYLFRDEAFNYLGLSYSDELFMVIFAYAISYFQVRIISLVFFSYLKVDSGNMGQIILAIIKVAGYVIAYRFNMALIEVLAIDLFAYLSCLGYFFIKWQKQIKPLSKMNNKSTFHQDKKRLIKYALFFNFNDVGGSFLGKDIANIILLKYLEPTTVAINALSYRISDIILRFSPIIYFTMIIRPLLFSLDPQSDKRKINILFSLLNKLALIVEIPVLSIVYVLSQSILNVIGGSEYFEYGNILSLIFLVSIINSMGNIVNHIAQLHERSDIIFYSKFAAVINVILSITLVQSYGIYGIIFATAVSNIIKNLFVWFFIKDYASYNSTLWFLVKYFPVWIIFTILIKQVSLLPIINDWIMLPILFVGVMPMLFISLKLNMFNSPETDLIEEFSSPKLTYYFRKIGFI